MAGWTTPKTWAVDELVTAPMFNEQLRDNMLALKAPPTQTVIWDNGADYATATTDFVPVDSTNLKLTLETTGGDVLVWFSGSFCSEGAVNYVMLDLRVDGSGRVGAPFQAGLACDHLSPPIARQVKLGPVLLTGLAAGVHTFELLWRSTGPTLLLLSNAANPALYYSVATIFGAREVS